MCVFLIGWFVISKIARMISILSLLSVSCLPSSFKERWYSVVPWTLLTLCGSKACLYGCAIQESTKASSLWWFFIRLWWQDLRQFTCRNPSYYLTDNTSITHLLHDLNHRISHIRIITLHAQTPFSCEDFNLGDHHVSFFVIPGLIMNPILSNPSTWRT